MASGTILAHDVFVRPHDPVGVALACAMTGGVVGAVSHHRANDELRRFGRARGQMPFPFLPASVATSTTAWVVSLLLWFAVVGIVGFYVVDLTSGGYEPGAEDISLFASLALLLAPMLLVTTSTLRRIRTAQHLAGVDDPLVSPLPGALLAVAFPPLGTWCVQRELNRVWREYA